MGKKMKKTWYKRLYHKKDDFIDILMSVYEW